MSISHIQICYLEEEEEEEKEEDFRIQRYCRGTQGAFGGCGGRLGNNYARQKAMNEVGGTNGGSGLV